VPLALALPAALSATIELSVDGILYRGDMMRQVELKADLDKGTLKLSQFSVELPGGSDLTLFGKLAAADGKPSFNGTLEAASDDLRGLLEWLKIDVSRVPAERLRKVVLSTGLGLSAEELDLRNLDANVDSTHLVGGATILLRVRPAFGASLAIDNLNLDGYLPQAPPAAVPGAPPTPPAPASTQTSTPPPAPLSPLASLDWLDSFDANIHGRVDHLIYRGQEIDGINLNGTVQSGTLTLHEATIEDIAGVRAKLAGTVTGPSERPQLDLTLDASAPEMGRFMRFIGTTPAVSPDQLGAFAVKGQLKGGLDKLALDIGGSAFGGSYKAAGTVGFMGGTSYDLDLSLDEPRLALILSVIAPNSPPPADLAGLTLAGHFKGQPGAVAVSGLKLQSGLIDATGDADVKGLPDRPTGKLDLAVTLRRLGYLAGLATPGLATPGLPANAMLDRLGPLALQLKADGDEKGVTLDDEVAAQGGSLSVTGRVGTAEKGLAYDLAVKAADADLTPLIAALLPGTGASNLGALKLDAHLAGGLENFTLSDLALSSSLLDASGMIELHDMVASPSVKAALAIDAKRLPLLIALAGGEPTGILGRLQTAGVKGRLEGAASAMTVDLTLYGDKANATVAGNAGLSDAGATYDLQIAAGDPDFPALLHALAPDYRPGAAALGGCQIQPKASGKPGSAKLDDIQAKLGTLTLSGNVAVTLNGPRPKFDVKLDAGHLDLGAWLPFKTAENDLPRGRLRGQAALVATTRWSSAPLDLSLLRSDDADIALSGETLGYGPYKIEGAKVTASLRDGVLDVSALTGKLAEGDLALKGRVDARSTPDATVDFRLDNAKLGAEGVRLGPLRLANGTVALKGALKTRGASELDLARGLDGDAEAVLTDATLEGLDIPALDAKLGKLDRSSDILGLMRSLTSGGTSRIARLSGSFTAHDGVVENRDLAIKADGAEGVGAGSFDLPRWYMDYGVQFKLTGAAGVPPFSIKLRGPLDDPRKFLLANELQEYLLDRGMKAILKDLHKGAPPPATPAPQ
jgi:hypothetical protein